MRKTILFATVALLLPLTIIAQTATGVIRGKLADAKSKEPLGFVSVALIPEGSSAPITGCSTSEDGTFTLTQIKNGNYTLRFSFVGYMDDTRKVRITHASPKSDIGTLFMKPDNKLLKEVVVTEQRSQMSFEIDKKVFTVDQNIAATGGSASDVLGDIPSVEVDNEGTVSLRGSESVTVWINGKAAGLTSDNQGDILQQMPAGSIEKIEVITNPSAKHSPEGTAGIINIVLKRDRKAGYYGSVQGGADTDGGYNASGNINYSSGTLDAYASISYRDMQRESDGKSFTEYFERDRYQRQNSRNEHNPKNIFARAGLTWRFTKNDEIYANLMGMIPKGSSNSSVETHSGTLSTLTTDETRLRTTDQERNSTMFNVEGGYRHTFGEGHFVDLSLNHNIWSMDNESAYRQQTTTADGNNASSYQFQNNEMESHDTEIKLDYENKLSENARIEAGYSGLFSHEKSPTLTYNDEAHTVIEKSLYNEFVYDQQTHALYGTYSGRVGNFGYQLGLRGEYWRVKTRSTDWEQHAANTTPGYSDNDFLKLFPSLFLSYSLPGGHEVQVNYTRRLRRPWGGQLNSFRNISDSTNISFGNPDLTPEYSNAYEINYIKNWDDHTLSLSGYYRTTDDVMERISYSQDNVVYTTWKNVASEQSAGLEIIGKNRLFRKLDLTTTINLFYYKLDGFTYRIGGQEITGNPDENFSWNARMTASLALPWQTTMQLTGRYNAKRIVAQGYREPSYSLDLGLRKTFDSHWSMSINARDLLDSRGWHTVTENSTFRRDSDNNHGGRRFGFTLTYSFGNMKAKYNTRKQNNNMNGGYDDYSGESEM